MTPIRFSREAKLDLKNIRAHIAKESPRAAAAVIIQIRQAVRETIARYPSVGILRPELHPGLRCFPVGSYVIFYRFGQTIDVRLLRRICGFRSAKIEFGDLVLSGVSEQQSIFPRCRDFGVESESLATGR